MISRLLLVVIIISGCSHNLNDSKRPNVLLILVDDLGYYDLGYMGSKYYETPNIDRLSEEGIIFTYGYSSSRVCSPSRASLMTGKFVTRHGITDYIGAPFGKDWETKSRKWGRHTRLLPPEYNRELGKEHLTIAEVLKDNGYRTFYAGKWHLGGDGSLPEDHGFEINKGGYHAGSPRGGYFAPYNNPKLEDTETGENLTIRLAEETRKFIENNKDTTFFAMLSFYAVHSPIQTTESKWQKYKSKAEKKGIAESGYKMESRFPIRQVQDNPIYGGLIESVDDAVGIVIDCLLRLRLMDNTLIIFTSDNGGVSSGDNYSTSLLPLRGGKGYQWEGGIRVPFIIRPPDPRQKRTSIDVPVINTDLFPTILDFAGIQIKQDHYIDGISLKPVIGGKAMPDRKLYWHYPHYGNQGGDPSSIVREGDWKLIHYWESGKDELYNLKDNDENKNLFDDYPETAYRLRADLLNWLDSTNARYAESNENFNQGIADSLYDYRSKILKERLERYRLEILSDGWEPNHDWWGSKVD